MRELYGRTCLSSILITLPFSSRRDSNLMDDPLAEEESLILLLPPCDEPRYLDWLQIDAAKVFFGTSDAGDNRASFLDDGLTAVTLNGRGRHFDRCEPTSLSSSSRFGDTQSLQIFILLTMFCRRNRTQL